MDYKKLENSKKGENYVDVEFSFNQDDIDNAIEKVYTKVKNKITIPGFRRGKAPLNIALKYYGKDVFMQDAFDELLQSFNDLPKEYNLKLAATPIVDLKEKNTEQGKISGIITYVIEPVAKSIENYKGIEICDFPIEITDSQIEEELSNMQHQNAVMIPVVDRPVQNMDIATIDFVGYEDGEQFPGGTAQNYDLKIGSKTFIPGFEEQIIGMKEGETRDIFVDFPEDYHEASMAGKPVKFVVTVNEIQEEVIPELDDEFAKDVSEFDTLDELKNSIKEKLEQGEKDHKKTHQLEDIESYICENVDINIPEEMIEERVLRKVDDAKQECKKYGLTLDRYLELFGQITLEEFKTNIRKSVIDTIKIETGLSLIGQKENIVATDDELNEEIKFIEDSYGDDFDKTKLGQEQIDYIKDRIIHKKVLEFLLENANPVCKPHDDKKEDSQKQDEQTTKTTKTKKAKTKKAKSDEEDSKKD